MFINEVFWNTARVIYLYIVAVFQLQQQKVAMAQTTWPVKANTFAILLSEIKVCPSLSWN